MVGWRDFHQSACSFSALLGFYLIVMVVHETGFSFILFCPVSADVNRRTVAVAHVCSAAADHSAAASQTDFRCAALGVSLSGNDTINFGFEQITRT